MTPAPSTPPTLRVQAELGYVRSCADCRTIANSTAASAAADPQVTSFRLVPGRKHACGRADEAPEGKPPSAPSGALTRPLEGQTPMFPEPQRTYEQ